MSQALREVITLIALIQEMTDHKVPLPDTSTTIKCTVFEDNAGAIELAKCPKMRPRTKYINVKYHHFRSFVQDGTIKLSKVTSESQLADILTKPLTLEQFVTLRQKIVGW